MAFLSSFRALWDVPSVYLLARALSNTPALLQSQARVKRPTFDGPTPPKKPLNSYMLFMADNKDKVPSLENNRLNMKALGEMWRGLGSSEKQVYTAKAAALKVQYQSDYDSFLKSLGGKKKQNLYLTTLAKYRADKKQYLKNFRLRKLDLIKPRKRSGYNMFLKEILKDHKVDEAKEIIKVAHQRWKELLPKDVKAYQKQAEEFNIANIAAFTRRQAKAIKEGILPKPVAPKRVVVKKTATKATAKKSSAKTKTKKAVKKGAVVKKGVAKKAAARKPRKVTKKASTLKKAAGNGSKRSAAVGDLLSEEAEQEEVEDAGTLSEDESGLQELEDPEEDIFEAEGDELDEETEAPEEGDDIFSDSDSEKENVAEEDIFAESDSEEKNVNV